MNCVKRIALMVIRNILLVPFMWCKLCYYAAHVDKYPEITRYKLLKYIVKRANKGGNVTIEAYGKENIPKEGGFMFFPNHQGLYDVLAIVDACPRPFSVVAKKEVAAWVEENKLHIMHNVTIDDLFHLHRGGRVSKASAIVGTMIQIKPIIHMDDHGELKVIGKERGRKKALTHIVDMAVKQSEGWDNDIVMITHGDCKEDAEFVARQVEKKMGVHNILINCIGTVIGSHTGPGVVAVFCMGNKR